VNSFVKVEHLVVELAPPGCQFGAKEPLHDQAKLMMVVSWHTSETGQTVLLRFT